MDKNIYEVENLPNRDGVYKVVQLYIDGAPKMYFADIIGHGYHRYILAYVLEKYGIAYLSQERRGLVLPEEKGERYVACGMGIASVFAEAKMIVSSFNSADYKIGINKDHLDKMGILHPAWQFVEAA